MTPVIPNPGDTSHSLVMDFNRAATTLEQPTVVHTERAVSENTCAYRLRPIMRQGTASSVPETWTRYPTLHDARQDVKQMYRNDRVVRVFVVTDEAPPRFVEWIER